MRPLAAAFILSLVASSGALAQGAARPLDCAGAARPAGATGGEGGLGDCRAVAASEPGELAPPSAADAAPAAAVIDQAPPAGPVPPRPPVPERKTEPNTIPSATVVDTPLPPPGGVPPALPLPDPKTQPDTLPATTVVDTMPPPPVASAPPPVADPIPDRSPALPTPLDLPRPPVLPDAPQPTPPGVSGLEPACCGAPGGAPVDPSRPSAAPDAPSSAPERGVDARLYAGLPWTQCGPKAGPRGRTKATGGVNRMAMPTANSTLPIDAEADVADYDRGSEVMRLRGGVQITQGEQHLEADQSSYDRKSGVAKATGHVYLEYPGARMLAGAADYNLQTKEGTLDDVRYRLSGAMNLRGTATTAALLAGEVSRYQDVLYTTCPPGRSDWSIRASDMELDHQEGLGVAHHARLRFGPVPVFYTPYLQFPIDNRRRSGLLIPVIGSSSNTGTDIIIPYYWNIAPNLDATFFPRVMSTRGFMLGTQMRALTKSQKEEFDLQVLPHDKAAPNLGLRWGSHLTQSGSYGGHWSSAIDYSAVSDDKFLSDFGNNLEVTSEVNLIRRGSLAYAGKGYSVIGWLQEFQTVDPTITAANRPYAQLPHVQLIVPKKHWGPLEYRFDAQYDYFDNPAKVYGSRVVVLPAVAWPWRRSFGHLIPRVRLFATGYELVNTAPNVSHRQSYVTPSLDVDAGLVFDRDTQWFGTSLLQTLEPRLYYVRTPYANQSTAPLFDTTLLTFSYASLFRANRFTGYDRISDEDRLTVGLTSRTLGGRDGREWLRLSLGQIMYFGSRRVQLTGSTVESAARSSMAGELATNPVAGWTGRASFQWDPNLSRNQWEQRALQLRYAPGADRVLNLAYLYSLGATVADRYENTDLSFRLPVTANVGVVGRWLYSVLQSNTVEAFGGIEYGGRCCWRVRLLGRRLQTSATAPARTSIMLQLELAGLGSLGDKIDKLLEQRIYGYDSAD